LRVRQNLIGFGNLLESFFGLFVSRITVRMIFQRQFTVGLFDFLFGGVPTDTKQFVVVAFAVQSTTSLKAKHFIKESPSPRG
jgi:hypothetical protein